MVLIHDAVDALQREVIYPWVGLTDCFLVFEQLLELLLVQLKLFLPTLTDLLLRGRLIVGLVVFIRGPVVGVAVRRDHHLGPLGELFPARLGGGCQGLE